MKLRNFLKILDEEGEYQTKNISYSNAIHDDKPYIFVLNNHYSAKKGENILAFNLNYLDFKNEKEKEKFIKKIQKFAKSKINSKEIIPQTKAALFNFIKKDHLTGLQKDKIYQKLIKEFPELESTVRVYKKDYIKEV